MQRCSPVAGQSCAGWAPTAARPSFASFEVPNAIACHLCLTKSCKGLFVCDHVWNNSLAPSAELLPGCEPVIIAMFANAAASRLQQSESTKRLHIARKSIVQTSSHSIGLAGGTILERANGLGIDHLDDSDHDNPESALAGDCIDDGSGDSHNEDVQSSSADSGMSGLDIADSAHDNPGTGSKQARRVTSFYHRERGVLKSSLRQPKGNTDVSASEHLPRKLARFRREMETSNNHSIVRSMERFVKVVGAAIAVMAVVIPVLLAMFGSVMNSYGDVLHAQSVAMLSSRAFAQAAHDVAFITSGVT